MAVQALAVNGAKVYIVGRTEEKLETVAETYGKDIPEQIIPLPRDISDKNDIKRISRGLSKRSNHAKSAYVS